MSFSLKISLLIYCLIGIVCAATTIFFVVVYRIGLPHSIPSEILADTLPAAVAVPVGDIVPPESIIAAPATIAQPSPTTARVTSPGVGLPLRLLIPKIKLDAAIEYVGLTPIGAMDTPKTAINVGWFQLGPRPGVMGSAVIAGHYGLSRNKPAAFDNLHTLAIGDKILVQDNKGILISFVVRKIQRFDPKADATTVFSSTDGKAHLNLITCEGIWDTVAKGYPKRLVIFADKE